VNVKKTICFVLVLAFAALLAFWIVHRSTAPEPTYAGRSFSSWFHEDELGPNYFNTAPATKAIVAMGPTAVPFLVARLQDENSTWISFYARHYSGIPSKLKPFLPAPRLPGVRSLIAARLLYELGNSARAAAPELIAAYGRASRTYLRLPFGPIDWSRQLTHALPPLVSAAPPQLPGENFQFWALITLAHTGADDPQVIPLLLSALHLPDANLHGLILAAMEQNTNLTTAINGAEPILLIALTDENPIVRAPAAEMLGTLAPHHPEVIPPLLKATGDLDKFVREAALKALAKSSVTLPAILPTIARSLNDTDVRSRMAALSLLMHANGGGGKIIASLTDSLDSADPAIRAAAAQALGFLGARAKASAAKLLELTQSSHEPDDTVRLAATNAWQKITANAIPASSKE
jgi:hypothetical protein